MAILPMDYRNLSSLEPLLTEVAIERLCPWTG
jgi:hypothetical protein